jgi:hypothetical protein
MTTTTKFNPETRKALVKAIGEILETKPVYLGVPSMAYAIGQLEVDKAGALTGELPFGLLTALHERGFDPEPPDAPEPAPARPDKTGLPRLYTLLTPRGEIHITEEFATRDEAAAEGYGEAFSTRLGTVYSYGDSRTFALVTESKAGDWDTTTMGRDFREAPTAPKRKGILDCLVEALNEDAGDGEKWERLHRPPAIVDNSGREHNLDGTFAAQTEYTERPDVICIEMPIGGFDPAKLDNLCKLVASKETLFKMALGVDALPIRVLEDRIAFPWFPYTEDADTIRAYSQLIAAICRTAKEKQRVNAQPKEDYPNPRFTMRCWLISLGLVGDEFRLIRKLMTATLPGNGAWSKGADPRKAAKAEAPAEEAVAETTTETDAAGEADLPGEEEGADNA